MWHLILLAANAPAEPTGGAPGLLSYTPFLFVIVLFYLLLIRPARTQEKQRQALVNALKKNDRIVNSGGIIGVVENIKEKEDEVVLKGGLRITKSSIVKVLGDDGKEQKDGGA